MCSLPETTSKSFSKYHRSAPRPIPLSFGPPFDSAHLYASLQSTQQHSRRIRGCATVNFSLTFSQLHETIAPGSAAAGAHV